MGFALSWVAIKGKTRDAILGELRLRPTGRREEIPEAPLVGASSADGWYLIVAQGDEQELLGPSVIERLARGGEAVTCSVEEHVMYSEASGWRDGQRFWLVTHAGEDGPKDVAATGALPAAYAAIRDRLLAQQQAAGGAKAEVDYLFDIPVDLAQSLVGFKHDQMHHAFEAQGFEELASTTKPPAKPKPPAPQKLGFEQKFSRWKARVK